MPKKLHALVKKLKKHKEIDNPWALGNWMLKKKSKKTRAERVTL